MENVIVNSVIIIVYLLLCKYDDLMDILYIQVDLLRLKTAQKNGMHVGTQVVT